MTNPIQPPIIKVVHGILYEITSSGTFLECVESLTKKECDVIYGPSGGILALDCDGGLCYAHELHSSDYRDRSLYFSAENYLGTWRRLMKISHQLMETGDKND